jgi:hypothetical protein
MIELHCLISGAMLGADRFRPASRGAENGFIGQGKWFRPQTTEEISSRLGE